jgi:uncharacterized protein
LWLSSSVAATAAAAELAITPLGVVADEIPGQRGTLAEREHRPWPLPERPWLMGQTWFDLLFAHWPVEPDALAPLIPEPLELDTRDGLAWLGITPFVIGGLRPQGAPPLPWLSHFPEINVRTYVTYGGRPGIWFFSLDAARMAAVAAARRGYLLPYFHARMRAERSGDEVRYESERLDDGPRAEFRATYGPSGPRLPIDDGSLERWLAERYCLYVVDERGRALRGEIHHPPWPLQPGRADIELNTMATELGLQLDGEPLLHFSVRQDTLIWKLAPA